MIAAFMLNNAEIVWALFQGKQDTYGNLLKLEPIPLEMEPAAILLEDMQNIQSSAAPAHIAVLKGRAMLISKRTALAMKTNLLGIVLWGFAR